MADTVPSLVCGLVCTKSVNNMFARKLREKRVVKGHASRLDNQLPVLCGISSSSLGFVWDLAFS